MGLSHLKTLIPQRPIMCTVLEPFTKLDPVSSWWIPSKDRLVEIYWNRQKASLWQEAMGNTQTGMQTETVETILVCLLFALVPGFHFSWVYHVKDALLQGPGGQAAAQTEGFFIPGLQSAETAAEGEACGQEKNVLSSFMPCSPYSWKDGRCNCTQLSISTSEDNSSFTHLFSELAPFSWSSGNES